jgi:outer membrane protein OmpA-like peptidoglycan-associated protein
MKTAMALACALPLVAGTAQAQVSIDNNALDALTPHAAPSHPAPRPRPEVRPAPTPQSPAAPASREQVRRPEAPLAATPAAPRAANAPPPEVPAAPPNVVVIPPPTVQVPTRPAEPPPPVPVAKDAPGTAQPIDGGVRVTFGGDRADLNPTSVLALKTLADKARAGDTPVTVLAYAPGIKDDPSTPRRLSLARGLAARAVLLNDGIASTRIYVRALGASDPGSGPADRVDVTLTAPGAVHKVPAPGGAQSTGTAPGGAQTTGTTPGGAQSTVTAPGRAQTTMTSAGAAQTTVPPQGSEPKVAAP